MPTNTTQLRQKQPVQALVSSNAVPVGEKLKLWWKWVLRGSGKWLY